MYEIIFYIKDINNKLIDKKIEIKNINEIINEINKCQTCKSEIKNIKYINLKEI